MDKIKARVIMYHNHDLISYIPSQRIDADGNIRGEDDDQLRFFEQYVMEIESVVGKILKHWCENNTITQREICEYLHKKVPTYDWRIIEKGIERHSCADFLSSIHILTPQLEKLLRDTVSNIIPTTQFNPSSDETVRTGIVYLHQILHPSNDEVKRLMGVELFWLALIFLVEDRGHYNIRNKISHGIISIEECNEKISALLIYLVLSLANVRTMPINDNSHMKEKPSR